MHPFNDTVAVTEVLFEGIKEATSGFDDKVGMHGEI